MLLNHGFFASKTLWFLFVFLISDATSSYRQQWSRNQILDIENRMSNEDALSNTLTPLDLVLLPESEYKTQRCLDGSPFGYYLRRSSSNENSRKWIFYLEGGGLCVEPIDCKIRQNSDQGSSSFWDSTHIPKNSELQDILSDNPEENPHFYDYNHVFLKYCSGDTWTGSRDSFDNLGFWFSGHTNIEATINHLNKTQNLDMATHFLLVGSSAGGIGVFNNADYFLEKWISQSTVFRAAPVSGFYFPGTLYLYPEFILDIEIPFNNIASTYITSWFGSALDESCARNTPRLQQHKCWDASYLYQFVDTRLFMIENRYDSNILEAILLCPLEHLHNNNTESFLKWFGDTMIEGLSSTIQSDRGMSKGDGLFSPSCLDHTDDFCIQRGPIVNGKRVDDMLGKWFMNDDTNSEIFQESDLCNDIQDTQLPCNEYCQC